MGFKLEQFKNHPRYDEITALLALEKSKEQKKPQPIKRPEISFVVPGKPSGKPRMTQRDKWKKRPIVLRYRDFCDRIRAAAPPLNERPDGLRIIAHLPVPDSWSKKRKKEMTGKPHRVKSDADNIMKAVADALFEDDSCIWDMAIKKFWCLAGQERTEISVLYCDDSTTMDRRESQNPS